MVSWCPSFVYIICGYFCLICCDRVRRSLVCFLCCSSWCIVSSSGSLCGVLSLIGLLVCVCWISIGGMCGRLCLIRLLVWPSANSLMVSLSSSSVAADNVEGVELSESSLPLSPQLAAPFLSTETAVGYLLFSFFLCFFHAFSRERLSRKRKLKLFFANSNQASSDYIKESSQDTTLDLDIWAKLGWAEAKVPCPFLLSKILLFVHRYKMFDCFYFTQKTVRSAPWHTINIFTSVWPSVSFTVNFFLLVWISVILRVMALQVVLDNRFYIYWYMQIKWWSQIRI